MRDRSLCQLKADLEIPIDEESMDLDVEAMELVVNTHVQNILANNEPVDSKASLTIGFFCAQLAIENRGDIGVVFFDAGIATTAILAAASFAKAVKYLCPSDNDDCKMLCVATTEELFYPKVKDSYVDFESASDTGIICNVYPRPKLDK